MNIGKLQQTKLTEEMKKSYLDYAMSVIVSRALPDIRDGLKPVHRRILYAMYKVNLLPPSRYTKSAKVVGEVLGKYHPHGDSPVYDALVRLAQEFSMRYRLVSGQGNFGSVDGDPPAAMRYTEVRLAKISSEMLSDIDKKTVEFTPNFDGTLDEPVWLPAKLPNLLLMGAEGIAVGMATKIPPHNLSEVTDAIVYTIDKAKEIKKEKKKSVQDESGEKNNSELFEFPVTLDDLMGFIKGPDFPTHASIYNFEGIKNAYATGKGKIIIRAKAEIEDLGGGKSAIVVTEIPYQVNKSKLVTDIARLVKNKNLSEISDLRDESDRRGIRVVIELKRNAVPRKTLNKLYKNTQFQTSYPVNMVALINGSPQTVTLKKIIEEYILHRYKVIRKRSEYELSQAKERAHILEGLKIAVDNIDEVIDIIRNSKDVDQARNKLISRFKLTEIQAQAILDMQLKKLAALERQKIEDELMMLKETIEYLEDLLSHPKKILTVAKDELLKLKEKYGDERKTRVFKSRPGKFSEEQLTPNEPTVITLTDSGYIKTQSPSTFKTQARGGKGVIGMTTKDEDYIAHLLYAETHDNILFFTDQGKVYQLRVWDIPQGSRIGKGKAIINLINVSQDEQVTSVLTYSSKDLKGRDANIFKATKYGKVKKTKLIKFKNIRSNGLVAIKLAKGDRLCWAKLSYGQDSILLVSYNGKSIKFKEKEVRPTGRDTMGVKGIELGKNDHIVGMEVVKKEDEALDFLTITQKGIGKKTLLSSFPSQHRGGKGLKVAAINNKTGKIASAQIIPSSCKKLILTSSKGQIVKVPISSVPRLSRATQGVILMRFSKKNDTLAAATCID